MQFGIGIAEHVRAKLVPGYGAPSSLLDGDAPRRRDWPSAVQPLVNELAIHANGLRELRGAAHGIAGTLDGRHSTIVKHYCRDVSSIAQIIHGALNEGMRNGKPRQLWLAARIRHVLQDNPDNLSASDIAARLNVTRQAVNGWVTTGRIGKEQIPKLAQLVRRSAYCFLDREMPDRILDPGEDVLQESDVTPDQARLVLAFQDLLPDQQVKYLADIEAQARGNREAHDMLKHRSRPKKRRPPKS